MLVRVHESSLTLFNHVLVLFLHRGVVFVSGGQLFNERPVGGLEVGLVLSQTLQALLGAAVALLEHAQLVGHWKERERE